MHPMRSWVGAQPAVTIARGKIRGGSPIYGSQAYGRQLLSVAVFEGAFFSGGGR